MKITNKNTIKAVVLGLGLGLFAAGNVNAESFTCKEIGVIAYEMTLQKLNHESAGEFMNAVDSTAKAVHLNDHDRKMLIGMAAMIVVREKDGRLTTTPRDFKKVCEERGPEKIVKDFHDVGVNVAAD